MIKNLDEFPFIDERPLDWGDMDAFGHINNVRFFRYFENARIAYLDKLNYHKIAKKLGVSVILGYIDCKFIRPLFYPDTIKVGARVNSIDTDRFNMDYAIFSQQQQAVVAVGNSTIVTYDYKNNCKAAIPEEFKQLLQNLS
jgi:acyl-CoA thioester hydrolase